MEAFLGEGGFGFVTKCRNKETDNVEAIKVNKNHPNIVHQAREEIAILKRLRCLDSDTCSIVKWNGYFFDKDHICLNFELLDRSLYDYMEDRNKGLPMSELRSILFQLATALCRLRSMEIVHADLKPDNVMVVDSQQQPLKVKLIDFGLARPVSAVQPGVCVQTTWYRAPEVMLHMPFNEAIDMWSLGLVAAELATGYPLYPGNTDYDMLSFIIETQGQPADHVLDRGIGTKYYFNKESSGWKFKTPKEFAFETGFHATETRRIRLKRLDDLEQLLEINRGHHSDHHLLVDLIKRMLQLDPEQRIKPLEVLQHPFFAHSLPQNSPTDTCIDMTDIEVETPVVSQQVSWSGPEDVTCRVDRTTASLTAQPEEKNTAEVDIQPETNTENVGWLRRFVRGMTEAFHFHFLRDE